VQKSKQKTKGFSDTNKITFRTREAAAPRAKKGGSKTAHLGPVGRWNSTACCPPRTLKTEWRMKRGTQRTQCLTYDSRRDGASCLEEKRRYTRHEKKKKTHSENRSNKGSKPMGGGYRGPEKEGKKCSRCPGNNKRGGR